MHRVRARLSRVSAIQHSSVAVDRETAERLLRQMLLIRRFEERTEEQYTRARIGGYCHLAIGEEAANVGAIEPLESRRLRALELPRPRHRAGRRLRAAPRDGRALRQGAPASPAATAARCTCSTSSATSSAAGASSAGSCRSPWASRSRSTTRARRRRARAARRGRDQHRRLPRVAQPGRDLAPAVDLPGHQQPLRHGHLGRDGLGRARAVEARRRLPHARRARRRQRPAGGARGRRPAARDARARSASRRCSRRRPTASAGTRWPTRARSTATPTRSPRRRSTIRSTASSPSRAIDAETVERIRTRGQRGDRRGHPPGRRRSRARSGQPLRQRLRRPGLARAVRAAWRAAAPFGEREGTRSWRT